MLVAMQATLAKCSNKYANKLTIVPVLLALQTEHKIKLSWLMGMLQGHKPKKLTELNIDLVMVPDEKSGDQSYYNWNR